MLRKIRIFLAAVFLTGITLLFVDHSCLHWFGWMAKVQFLPALLALNIGALALIVVLTLLFGRLYCSAICPLGVMQDIFAWIGRLKIFRKKKGKLSSKYSYSKPKTWLRLTVLVVFAALVVAGVNAVYVVLAPYSMYGSMMASIFHPMAVEMTVIAGLTALVLFVLAFMNGRTYCNTICPVGTVLGFLSRFSLLKMHVDESKCNKCGLCGRNCKASCIDSPNGKIDYSRCVACGDCEKVCAHGAISFGRKPNEKCGMSNEKCEISKGGDMSRRGFLGVLGVTAAAAVQAQGHKTTDGGLAVIEDKQVPDRHTPLTPPGSLSARHFHQHCTACQLCITNCPNHVLRPSTSFEHLMQPEMGYENGYCRPECSRCSWVCPTGAIKPIMREQKSSLQIGHAVWVSKNCIPLRDGKTCGNCARHCPTGSIQMVPIDKSIKEPTRETLCIPVINTETCIGCGACENLCPARPFSAIVVHGHEVHREI